MKYSKGWGAVLVIILLLILDQVVKIWVKTHMYLYSSIEVTSWFQIYFTENPGMAFGMQLMDKLYLTLFRIIAVGFIGYYLYRVVRQNFKFGYVICISLIFAGAVGNIIDSVFYGVFFEASSTTHIAAFLPAGGGYESWMHGMVVDMFYFPLIDTVLPDWVPIWGGQKFVFFRPIFNLADSAICVGVFILFLFYRKTLSDSLSKEEKKTDAAEAQ